MDDVGLDEQDFQARGPLPINFTPKWMQDKESFDMVEDAFQKWQGGSGHGSFDMGGMVDPLDEPIGKGATRADWEAWKTSQGITTTAYSSPKGLSISGVGFDTKGKTTIIPDSQLAVFNNDRDVFKLKPLAAKKLDPRAHLPTRAYSSNGFDLKCIEGGEVKYGEITKLDTGIARDLTGYALLIVPKSGLAVKHGIHVMAGLVDSDWRGSVQVCLTKLTPGSHIFRDGDKIAQFILIRTKTPEIQEVAELPETQRGDKGFGSSGA